MSHLGDRISAFVDGELSHDARERTLAHLAGCAECRAEAEAERRVRKALARMGQPQPSGDLMSRLMAIGGGPPTKPTSPAERALPGLHQRSLAGSTPLPVRPRNTGVENRRPPDRSRRLAFVTAGAFSLAAFTLTTTFALGGQDEEERYARVVTPPVDQYHSGPASVLNGTSLPDPAFGVMSVSQGRPGLFGPLVNPVPMAPMGPPFTPMPQEELFLGPAGTDGGPGPNRPDVVPLRDSSADDPQSPGGSSGIQPR